MKRYRCEILFALIDGDLRKLMWNVLSFIDLCMYCVPGRLRLFLNFETLSYWGEFIEMIHQYWRHIKIRRMSGYLDVVVVCSISSIPDIISGLSSAMIVPKFAARGWKVCFIVAEESVERET